MIEGRPSRTAEGVALQRALDLLRPASERILYDPFAPDFLSRPMRRLYDRAARLGPQAPRSPLFLPALSTFVCARHAYMDQAMLRAVAAGAKQVVLLGAGYDSRALRFAQELAQTTAWELDFPATQARKLRCVERAGMPAPGNLLRVPVDFRHDSWRTALVESGFDASVRTFWIWEGVSMYLPTDAVDATLADVVALSGPGSELVLDTWGADRADWLTRGYDLGVWFLGAMGEPILFQLLPGAIATWAEQRHFTAVDVCDGVSLRERHARGRRMYAGCAVATLRVRSGSAA